VIPERAAARLRALERRMVEDIEELGAEINRGPLRDLRSLDDRHVPVLLEWAAEGIAADVANRCANGRRVGNELTWVGRIGDLAGDYRILVVRAIPANDEVCRVYISIDPIFHAARNDERLKG